MATQAEHRLILEKCLGISEEAVKKESYITYVREREDYRGTPYYQNNMEPRVRGKHAESLGWNTENYYLQRGY